MTLNFEDSFVDILDNIVDPIDNFGDNFETRKKVLRTKLINDPYLTGEQRCLISNMITQWKD